MDINVKISGLDEMVEAFNNLAEAITAAAANNHQAADEAISKAKAAAKKSTETSAKPAASAGKKSTGGTSAQSQDTQLAPETETTEEETTDEAESPDGQDYPALDELQAAAAKAAKKDRDATKAAVSKYAAKLSEVAEEDRAALIKQLEKI